MIKFEFATTEQYINHATEQAHKYLDKCEIYQNRETRKYLRSFIRNVVSAKGYLLSILEKDPGYNGNGQVVRPFEVERPIDKNAIINFSSFIRSKAKAMYVDMVVDGVTYKEATNRQVNLNGIIRCIDKIGCYGIDDYEESVLVDNKKLSDFEKELEAVLDLIGEFELNGNYIYPSRYITADSYEKVNKIIDMMIYIENKNSARLDDSDPDSLFECFRYFGLRPRAGQKLSQLVLKVLKKSGLYEIMTQTDEGKKEFNSCYASFADAINPTTITKWSVLSVNPVDYLTMSLGNSWTSCLNTDKGTRLVRGNYSDGFNSRRTMDYALDPSTMVFYTIDENYDGDEFELQKKSTRQLFHFGEDKLIQSRLYPQMRTARREIYTQYRNLVQSIIANGLGEANLWSNINRGEISPDDSIFRTPYHYSYNGNYIDFSDEASHGYGENDFQTEVNWCYFKGSLDNEESGFPMTIGSIDARDIITGDELDEGYTNAITRKYTW